MKYIKQYWRQILAVGAVLLIFFLAWGLDPESPSEQQQRYSIEQQQQQKPTNNKSVNYDSAIIKEQIEQQNLGDAYFSESAQEMEKAYPWFSKLPIKKDTYTIVYDYDLQKFRIKLKIGANKDTAVPAALSDLRAIGVTPTASNYYVN